MNGGGKSDLDGIESRFSDVCLDGLFKPDQMPTPALAERRAWLREKLTVYTEVIAELDAMATPGQRAVLGQALRAYSVILGKIEAELEARAGNSIP